MRMSELLRPLKGLLSRLHMRQAGKVAALDASGQARLQALQALPPPDMDQPACHLRWVVVDVETSGLNIAEDRLLAIGAVAVRNGQVDLADSLEVVLHQSVVSSDANILIHRLSGGMQRGGEQPTTALLEFLEYVGNSPLVGFHARFDETMLRRACGQHLGYAPRRRWLDVAALAPALFPVGTPGMPSLDWWLERFLIKARHRHNAAADAFYTAQLMAIMLAAGAKATTQSGWAVLDLTHGHDWLSRWQPG